MLGFIATLLLTITAYILAALGELVCERSGVLNLGVQGMMLFGAAMAAIVGITTGSALLAMLAAMLATMLIGSVFAFLVLKLQTNQVATGLALTFFGSGLAAMFGKAFIGQTVPSAPSLVIFDSFRINSMTIMTLILLVVTSWFLQRTRGGLILRAVGENHHSAHALGISVLRIRLYAIWFGAVLAGLSGATFTLMTSHAWSDGDITSARGWIAVALVVFASWRVDRLFLGALLFGSLDMLQLRFQDYINTYFLQTIPYLATIVVLVLISKNQLAVRVNTPACLGKNFHAVR